MDAAGNEGAKENEIKANGRSRWRCAELTAADTAEYSGAVHRHSESKPDITAARQP